MKLIASILALLGSTAHGCEVKANYGTGWFSMGPGQIPDMSIFTKTPMDYIEGSRTYDTFREAKTQNFPLAYHWTDATNVQWSVGITSQSDACTIAVPCNPSTMFFGDRRDRVGMDAQVNVCKFVFNYQPSSTWHSHGLRCQSNGYRYKGMGIYMSDSDKWKSVLEMVKSGLSIADAALDVYTKAAAIGVEAAVAAPRLYQPMDYSNVEMQAPISGTVSGGRGGAPQWRPDNKAAPVLGRLRNEIANAQRKTQSQLMQFNKLRDMVDDAKRMMRQIDDFIQNVEQSNQLEVADLSTAQAYLDRLDRMLR